MKKYITLLLLLFGLVLQAQTRDKFVGNWVANDGSVIIIYIQDASYYAKADGKYVLIQMEKKSDTQLYGGTFYDEKLKTEYEAKLKLTDDNSIKLKVMNGFSGKTIIWHRLSSLERRTNEITAK
ncbi:MAG: DUF2147 domain-containing protein [Flavobacterium sp. JAD_PAG50586_2]|nr:MAG: DUF2147 domain-containing protein [Flavobacterium sp. JAD_PAG50586_2]